MKTQHNPNRLWLSNGERYELARQNNRLLKEQRDNADIEQQLAAWGDRGAQ